MDQDRGEHDTAEVGQGVLVVSARDATPLLEPVEAALDGVAVAVQLGVEGPVVARRRSPWLCVG